MRDEILDYLNVNIVTGIIIWKQKSSRKTVLGSIAGTFKDGYRDVVFRRKHYRIHHIIWRVAKGYWPKELDHVNRNKSDNRIVNLREADRAEQAWNTGLSRDNTSGIKGVSWHKKSRMWRVRINVRNEQIYLGIFKDKSDAERRHQQAVKHYHGDFASV